MEICVSTANWELCFREKSAPEYVSEDVCRSWTGCSEQRLGSEIEILEADRVVPLDSFSLLEVLTYRRSVSYQSIVLVEPVKAHVAGGN